MIIRVQRRNFNTEKINRELRGSRCDIGAITSFVGLVRDHGQLQSMTLEHYPGMTENCLLKIAQQACQQWKVIDLAIIHRIGKLKPADQIVLVSVISEHRKDSFSACEFIMDYLKTDAPFWKKESATEGSSWVEAKKSDQEAREKW